MGEFARNILQHHGYIAQLGCPAIPGIHHHDVWTRNLLRSTEKARFRGIWSQFSEATIAQPDALESLYLS